VVPALERVAQQAPGLRLTNNGRWRNKQDALASRRQGRGRNQRHAGKPLLAVVVAPGRQSQSSAEFVGWCLRYANESGLLEENAN